MLRIILIVVYMSVPGYDFRTYEEFPTMQECAVQAEKTIQISTAVKATCSMEKTNG